MTTIHSVVMPWMYGRVLDFINDDNFMAKNLNAMLQDTMDISSKLHYKRVL
jgi:hypothetical protein